MPEQTDKQRALEAATKMGCRCGQCIAAALLRAEARGWQEAASHTEPCRCHEGYTTRKLRDPDCRYHDLGTDYESHASKLEKAAKELEGE